MKKVKERYVIVGKPPQLDKEKVLLTIVEDNYITDITLARRLRNDMENEFLCKDCRVVKLTDIDN